MSLLNVDKVDPNTGTALELGTSGDTITVPTGAGLTVTDEVKTNKISPASGTAFALGDSGDTFTVPSGATLDISASTLTPPATMPASSGVNLTALNATQLTSGTVPAARLSGVGKIGQVLHGVYATVVTISSETYTQIGPSVDITPSATSSKILLMFSAGCAQEAQEQKNSVIQFYRDTTGLGNVQGHVGYAYPGDFHDFSYPFISALDSPSSTSTLTYMVKSKMSQDSGQQVWNMQTQNGNRAFMTVMEVLA